MDMAAVRLRYRPGWDFSSHALTRIAAMEGQLLDQFAIVMRCPAGDVRKNTNNIDLDRKFMTKSTNEVACVLSALWLLNLRRYLSSKVYHRSVTYISLGMFLLCYLAHISTYSHMIYVQHVPSVCRLPAFAGTLVPSRFQGFGLDI